MHKQFDLSRRGFMGTVTLGVASLGLGRPSILDGHDPYPLFDPDEAGTRLLRLDRNESPYGLSPASAQAIRSSIESESPRYPFEESEALHEAIAEYQGVAKEQVLLGYGSIEILKIATETFCSPARPAVVAEPTFEAVVGYCPLAHARAVKIPLTKDYKHDLPRMRDAAGQGAGLIFFCNPANPAGTFINKQEVEKLVRAVPSGAVLLVDEAYFDFVDRPDYESCIHYVREGLPIIVSRTFSKIYGMAGLRVGYAVGHKDLIQQMTVRRLDTSPNQLAIAAALAALKQDAFVARIRRLNAEVREFTARGLQAMHLDFIPSETNFVMVDLGRPAKPVIEALKQRQVLVARLFPSMPNHMRVTLGTGEDMQLFMKEFKKVMASA